MDIEKSTKECCKELKLKCLFDNDWKEHRCITYDQDYEIDFYKIDCPNQWINVAWGKGLTLLNITPYINLKLIRVLQSVTHE